MSVTAIENLPTPPNAAKRIWDSVTKPSSLLKSQEQQRARLLASVLVVFTPLSAVIGFGTPISNLLSGRTLATTSWVIYLALLLLPIAYGLSRTRYYTYGARLALAVPVIAVLGQIMGSQGLTSTIPLFFLVLSVTLAGLLLSSGETLLIGLVLAIVTLLLPYSPSANPAIVSPTQIFAVFSFLLTTTAITVLVGRIREENLRQLERQQAELTASLAETDAARKQAERSDKVKSAFLASMSHELRTPLNAIINFTEFVAAGDTGPVNDEQKELLDEVIGSGKHLLNLINDVLDMSKIEAGSLNLFIEDNIDLKAILENGLSTCRRLVKDGVELHSTIAPDLPPVRGDRQRLLQVLLNILSNACKFTDQGEIKLNAVVNKGEIVVSVTDTGPGIAPADQAAVFEAFKQTTVGLRQGRGTGLGMPIARSLIEAHGGRLWLESQPGAGSTFSFALPVTSTILKPTL